MRVAMRERGFSLLEVLCAMAVLGLTVAGLSEGISVALRSMKDAEEVSRAALLAAGQIEVLRVDGLYVEGEEEGEFGAETGGWRWRRTVERTSPEGLYQVKVEVEAGEGRRLAEIVTLLFDPPYLPLSEEPEGPGGRDRRRDGARRGAGGSR